MTAIRVTRDYFQGSGRLFGQDGLGAVICGLAIDHARLKVQNAQIADITDSTTGVPAASIVNMVIPAAAYDATSSGGAQRAGFNTAVDKIENAGAVLADRLNQARARLGLPVMFWASGPIATPGTLPAQDLSVSAATGTSALDFASGVEKMRLVKANMRKLARATNEVLAALGEALLPNSLTGDFGSDYGLVAVADAAASATGASAISKTVADAFLAASAANFATVAMAWNNALLQGEITDLTDSSGGTSAVGLAANVLPTPANGAATTSSPKAGFDAELVKIENNLSDLCARMNVLRDFHGLARYTDSTGASPDATIEALLVNLTAVDGSSGTVAVDQVSALARMTTIHSALKSLRVGVNDVRAKVGLVALTDALATGAASTTIANLAATSTGVSGVGATLLDTEVDVWLTINRNNVATLAKGLNDITGTGMVIAKSLGVVAA